MLWRARSARFVRFSALLLLSINGLRADDLVYDLESLVDGTSLTTQISGLTFGNSIVLSSRISLNEYEFPAHSGVNAVSDNGEPITIVFESPVQSFAAYFTYGRTLNIQAFNEANQQVAAAVSRFSNNEALSGVSGACPLPEPADEVAAPRSGGCRIRGVEPGVTAHGGGGPRRTLPNALVSGASITNAAGQAPTAATVKSLCPKLGQGPPGGLPAVDLEWRRTLRRPHLGPERLPTGPASLQPVPRSVVVEVPRAGHVPAGQSLLDLPDDRDRTVRGRVRPPGRRVRLVDPSTGSGSPAPPMKGARPCSG